MSSFLVVQLVVSIVKKYIKCMEWNSQYMKLKVKVKPCVVLTMEVYLPHFRCGCKTSIFKMVPPARPSFVKQ